MDYALPIGAGVVSAFLTIGGVVCLLFMGHFLDCGAIGAAWGLWAGAAVINILAWFCAPYQIMVVYTFLVLLSFVLLIALSFARGKKRGGSSCCGCDGGSSCCSDGGSSCCSDGGSSCCSDGHHNPRYNDPPSRHRHHSGSGSSYSDNGDRPGLRYTPVSPSSSSSSSSYSSSYSSKSHH